MKNKQDDEDKAILKQSICYFKNEHEINNDLKSYVHKSIHVVFNVKLTTYIKVNNMQRHLKLSF